MLIPSQLPQFVTPARPGALQALALQSGQVLDARIVGPAPGGATQVEIRGQLLNLILPTAMGAGEMVRLQVQGAGQQMRLALQAATAPATNGPATAAPAPAGAAGSLSNQPSAAIPQASVAAPNAPPLAAIDPASIIPASLHQAARPAAAMPATSGGAALPPGGGDASVQSVPPGSIVAGATPSSVPGPAGGMRAQPASAPVVHANGPAAQPAAAAPILPASQFAPAPAASTAFPLAIAAVTAAIAPRAPAAPAPSPGPAPVQAPAAISASGSGTAHSSPGNPSQQSVLQQPTTPQAALAHMVQTAAPRQGSVAALTAALVGVAGKLALPEPVIRAAQQVLAGRLAVNGQKLDGAALHSAIRGSGVFQEANLAQGRAAQSQTDIKSALLSLRQTLVTWLGQQAPVNAVAPIPPPVRGGTPRAGGAEAPPLDPKAAPEEIGRQLLERTEAALSRMRLLQHSSLPDQVARSAEWNMELPLAIGTHQAVLQIQIHQDQQSEAETAAERGWQMRFAINLPGMGEVGAQVTLRSGATGVMLWAAEPAASAALEAQIADLRGALASAGLRPGAVIVRHRAPPAPSSSTPSGHFVDAHS